VVETEIIVCSLSSAGVPLVLTEVWDEEVGFFRRNNRGSRTGGVGICAADTDLDRGGRTTLDGGLSAGGAVSWASPSETNCSIESHSFASILVGTGCCTTIKHKKGGCRICPEKGVDEGEMIEKGKGEQFRF
jgi:hypothetical protein